MERFYGERCISSHQSLPLLSPAAAAAVGVRGGLWVACSSVASVATFNRHGIYYPSLSVATGELRHGLSSVDLNYTYPPPSP